MNVVSTHGHPRALVGAVLHAVALGTALESGNTPGTGQWQTLLEMTEQAVNLIDEHPQLSSLWRPSWEQAVGYGFNTAWHEIVDECREMLPAAIAVVRALQHAEKEQDASARNEAYSSFVSSLSLADPSVRGSGTATVIASLALAAAYPVDPARCSLVAAEAVGTDTDTIATMAAALVGAVTDVPDPTPLQDSQYLVTEARRLTGLAFGEPGASLNYPDPINWVPPSKQLDAVGMVDGEPALAGLGWLQALANSDRLSAGSAVWQWMRSDFGPTFLLKQRPVLRLLPDSARPMRRGKRSHRELNLLPEVEQVSQAREHRLAGTERTASSRSPRLPVIPEPNEPPIGERRPRTVDVDQMLAWVAHKGYSDEAIGYAVRRILELGSLEQLIAFATSLRASARRSRRPKPKI
ncbi:hypothetical protein BKA01_008431 [Pseudonocardia eucalypti]|nr:hypothetical protein [Pseudonocardia eucalypti]